MAKKTNKIKTKDKAIIDMLHLHLSTKGLENFEIEHLVLKPKKKATELTCPEGTKPTLVRQGGRLVLRCV